MKLLFIADIHIKLGQKNVPKEWAINRFNMFLHQFLQMQIDHTPDLVVLGGDVFDKVPTPEEMDLYFQLIEAIDTQGIVYSGNHEMLKKHTSFMPFFSKSTTAVNEKVWVVDDFFSWKGIDFIPYTKLKTFEKSGFPQEKNRILCSHFRAEIPPHVKPEIDLDKFNDWELVLAGDLHSYENSQRNILYPGSPYTITFHRNRVKTGAILLDTETLEHDFLEFDLPQLIKKTVSVENADQIVEDDFDLVIYEVEGDVAALASLEDNKLIGKKLSKRSIDTALILDAEMSKLEELSEYLTYILQIPEPEVKDLVSLYAKLAATENVDE